MSTADIQPAYQYRPGGLMRCCTQTLSVEGRFGTEGEVMPCRWCSSSMVHRDGAWEWNHPRDHKATPTT